MNETYVECMVKRETKVIVKFLKIFLITLAVVLFIASVLLLGSMVGFIISIALGVGAYFLGMYSEVEFEYLYVDKQITVDKIFNKAKRKRAAVYDVEKMEILAPFNSHYLDDYKNRQVKEVDYSSRVARQPEKRYVFFYEGQQKIIIEPNEEFIKAIYNVAPRKVMQY